MFYTIYFTQKPLYLADSKGEFPAQLFQNPTTAVNDHFDETTVDAMIAQLQHPQIKAGIICHQPATELLQVFKEKLTVIEAGGGFVYTDDGSVLLIFRKGKWDLPKGKLDAGETQAAAAVREVEEETGLRSLQLEAPLTTTYHTYWEKERLILKESYWFLMKSPKQESLIPQLEEDIEKCEWVKLNALDPHLQNTHPSVIDVLRKGFERLNQTPTF